MITYILEAIKNYRNLKIDYENLSITLAETQGNLETAEEKIMEIKKNIFISCDDKVLWDSRWKQSKVFYSAPSSKWVCDYVAYREIGEVTQIAKNLISSVGLLKERPDKVPIAVMNYIREMDFKYKLEKGDIWKQPEQTLKDIDIGNDCDDIGILEYFIIREIFKQLGNWEQVKHRLKCQDCHVFETGTINVYAGRHFNLIWLFSDSEWQTLESTFYLARAILNFGKKPQKLNDQYGLINYTFNEYASWSQKSITITEKDYSKVTK